MYYMATISLRIPDELLELVDQAAQLADETRTGWLLAGIEERVGRVEPEALEEVRVEDSPPKPRKYTPAEMARLKNNGAKMGWTYETSGEFRERAGIKPNVPKDS